MVLGCENAPGLSRQGWAGIAEFALFGPAEALFAGFSTILLL
jgi:hypothetical protein